MTRRVTLILVMMLLLNTGCRPGAETQTGGDGTTEQALPEETLARGPGVFDLADPATRLEDLDSYLATLTIRFEGSQDGQPLEWSRTYALAVTREPPARLLTVSASPANPALDLSAGVVDGVAYSLGGAQTVCAAAAWEPGDEPPPALEPASLLPPVLGAEAATTGQAPGGTPASHHTFDKRAVAAEGASTASGEMWIAPDGGYLLGYTLREQGPDGYYGEAIVGTMTWEYVLEHVNDANFTVSPPSGCPAGLVDAPVLPDAADIVRQPGFLTYTTATNLAAILAFYQEQLPGAGWQPQGEPMLATNQVWLESIQGSRRLSIQAAAFGDMVRVSIWLEMVATSSP